MIIKEIQIYGYGKLENVSISNLNSFCVFYGENEAGKSTIMSFIHSMFFGFPTKVQAEQRYEPKSGIRYGGKLLLKTSDKGRIVIERTKGKATGDVTVTLEDGTRGGEDLLKELLSRMDKSLYQSIFSFNLQGLQNIHQLKKEDLGRFLFSTGAIGTDRLVSINATLQKELDERFKPSGKKPIINEKLKELKEVYSQLKGSENKNEGYWQLERQRDELVEEISQLARKEENLLQELQQLKEWKKLEPVVKELEYVNEKIKGKPPIQFPVDGIKRLDQIIQWMKPLEAEKERLDRKILELNEEIRNFQPNLELLEKEVDIQDVLDRLPLLETLCEEEKSLRIQIEHLQRQKRESLDKLHIPLNDDALLNIDTSMFMKERVNVAHKKQWKLNEKKEELDALFEQEKMDLELLENKIASRKSELLSEKEFRELEEEVMHSSPSSLRSELIQVKQTINMLKGYEEEASKDSRNRFFQYLTLTFVCIFLGVFGVLKSESLLILFSISLILIVLVSSLFTKMKKPKKNSRTQLEELIKKEKELDAQIQGLNPERFHENKGRLEKEKQKAEEFKILNVKWEQQNNHYERIISEFEKWETESAEIESELKFIAQKLCLSEEITKAFLVDTFDLLVRLKSMIHDQNALQLQLDKKTDAIQKISNRIEELGRLFIQKQIPVSQLAMELRNRLREEQQKFIIFSGKNEKLEESTEELERVQSELNQFVTEMKELFVLADVINEEEYRRAGLDMDKQNEERNKVEELEKQIAFSSLTKEAIEKLIKITDIDQAIKEKSGNIEQNHKRREEALKTLSETKHQISILEEGGMYSELLHKYTQLKAELEDEAKDWARIALAKELLNQTMRVFNEEKLPAVLEKAEEYLSFLTDGNYQRIVPKENESGFHIHRKDYSVFEANELSQATMEQVYVAIRLALVTTIYKKRPFPIMIDDSFVNFDHIRTSRVLQLLRKITNNQVIFFTCHRHLLKDLQDSHIIRLEEIPVPQLK
ncbi:AAA family ATPase [Robertmurraya korlensis]|uniref:ATP-binding protein n=1 Tax=Robertmurraya korlensis TaxID=519977 RepID=UPI00203E4A0B|nr:AAA family ATPase [Robertmurraya korlensis]MCM3602269.1 AAA family ATPase [Robertmurraya korlensis]